MADVWVATIAQDLKIPMISVAREDGFLTEDRNLADASLYREYRHNDDIQTDLLQSREPLILPRLGRR